MKKSFSLANLNLRPIYESEDDDGPDPCAYCGHDPCRCPDDDDGLADD